MTRHKLSELREGAALIEDRIDPTIISRPGDDSGQRVRALCAAIPALLAVVERAIALDSESRCPLCGLGGRNLNHSGVCPLAAFEVET